MARRWVDAAGVTPAALMRWSEEKLALAAANDRSCRDVPANGRHHAGEYRTSPAIATGLSAVRQPAWLAASLNERGWPNLITLARFGNGWPRPLVLGTGDEIGAVLFGEEQRYSSRVAERRTLKLR